MKIHKSDFRTKALYADAGFVFSKKIKIGEDDDVEEWSLSLSGDLANDWMRLPVSVHRQNRRDLHMRSPRGRTRPSGRSSRDAVVSEDTTSDSARSTRTWNFYPIRRREHMC